ncbi:MAG TPA: hypothetical protein PKM73_08330 [Verrucomicrobiota bacterium]|nr:hypothetical protein [Verrucomicrobiota bacterium]HNU49554.1 hypothetical protein [Verrucomicrobiota bacterium]
MKRPAVLHLASLLLALKSVQGAYRIFGTGMEFRYQVSMSILVFVFLATIVLLYCRPRIGRWPAGLFFLCSALLALRFLIRGNDSLATSVQAFASLLISTWLANALLGGKTVTEYLKCTHA